MFSSGKYGDKSKSRFLPPLAIPDRDSDYSVCIHPEIENPPFLPGIHADSAFHWCTGSFTPTPMINIEIPSISYKKFKDSDTNKPRRAESRILYKPKIIRITPRSCLRLYEYNENKEKVTSNLERLKSRFSPSKKLLYYFKSKNKNNFLIPNAESKDIHKTSTKIK